MAHSFYKTPGNMEQSIALILDKYPHIKMRRGLPNYGDIPISFELLGFPSIRYTLDLNWIITIGEPEFIAKVGTIVAVLNHIIDTIRTKKWLLVRGKNRTDYTTEPVDYYFTTGALEDGWWIVAPIDLKLVRFGNFFIESTDYCKKNFTSHNLDDSHDNPVYVDDLGEVTSYKIWELYFSHYFTEKDSIKLLQKYDKITL